MADLKLGDGGDLDLTAGAVTLVTGSDAIAQQLRIALRLFKGEWFLSPTEGIPYFEQVFQKGVRPAALEALFRRALLKVPGVLEVITLDLDLVPETRKLLLTFEVSIDGSDTPLVFERFEV